jgi:hypothetical protein
MRHRLIAILAAMVFLIRSSPSQPQPCSWPEFKAPAENLNFADGSVGAPPKGWLLGPEWFMPPHQPVYEAIISAADQCHGNPQCATVRSLRSDPSVRLAFLYQDLDASPYRGQTLTWRAFVRVDPHPDSVARLLVRVHRKDCSTTFRDDMGDHPITSSDWAPYEIRAPIAGDAYHVEFGMQLIGRGAAWLDQVSIDQVSMEFAPVR